MLWGKKEVLANIRNRDGKRVFYLGKGDLLTSDAKDELARQRIEILPADAIPKSGDKPENMTHLNAQQLVEKTHPRIRFRGAVDILEAELLLAIGDCPGQEKQLGEVLELARRLIRCDVLNEPVGDLLLGGMDEDALRRRSHRPQDFYGVAHFMPSAADGGALLVVNRLRALVRQVELKAVEAFPDRQDMVQALNRMSSYLYLMMVQMKGIENGKLKMEN